MQWKKLRGKDKADYQASRRVAAMVFKIQTENPTMLTADVKKLARQALNLPPKSKRKSRRAIKARSSGREHAWVCIGTVMVKKFTSRGLMAVVPDGRTLWLPRSSIKDGNMNFRANQLLKVWVDRWLAERAGLKWTVSEETAPKQKTDDSPAVHVKTTAHHPYPNEAAF